MSDSYKRVPISAAKRVANTYDKSQVIILTWDPVYGKTHITTYGKTKEDCRQAALGGSNIAKLLKLKVGYPHDHQ